MKTETEGTQQRDNPRKICLDCVNGNMESYGLFHEDAQDKDYWTQEIKGNG